MPERTSDSPPHDSSETSSYLQEHPVQWQDDPIMLRCRREALMILGLWLCCFLWTTTYCYLNGYLTHEPLPPQKFAGPDIAKIVVPPEEHKRTAETLTYPFGLGIPDWVFWGVVVPWVICIVVSLAFCLFVFAEDDLSGTSDDELTAESESHA